MVHGAFGVNVIEPVGEVVELGLGHVPTLQLSLAARIVPLLGLIKRLNCAT